MINSTNQTYFQKNPSVVINIEMPWDIVLLGSTLYSLIFLFGLIGNTLIICVLIKEKDLRSFTNYLLANLAVADLMVLLACVPTGLHDLFAKERWHLGKVTCYLIGFIENFTGVASILTIFFITCERYFVIVKPLGVRSLLTQSRILKIIIFIWLVSAAINFPIIFMTEYKLTRFIDNKIEYQCLANTNSPWRQYYICIVTFIIYLLIGVFLLLMFMSISHHLRVSTSFFRSTNNSQIRSRHKKSIDDCKRDKNTEEIKILNEEHTQQLQPQKHPSAQLDDLNYISNLERYVKPRKQLILMLMYVILAFYLCLFPLKLWNICYMFIGHKKYFTRVIRLRHYWYINIVARAFFYLNSSINVLLYYRFSTKFRFGFRRLISLRDSIDEGNNNNNNNNTI